MPDDIAAFLRDGKYVSLETYRSDGTGVKTPVWFVVDGGRVFCRSDPASAKIRRIRRNPAVTIAPCSFRGAVKGERRAARAGLVPEQEWPRLEPLYARKYRLEHVLGRLFPDRGPPGAGTAQLYYEILTEQ